MKCKKCLEEKDKNDFYTNSLMCKKCRCEQCNEWRKANKEKVAASRKRKRENNIEKARQKDKELYKKNHEKFLEKAKNWRENNPQKTRDATKKWQKNNIEKRREYSRKNKEKQKEYHKKYKEKNVEKYNAIVRKNMQRDRQRHPEKHRARKILFCALRTGFMTKPEQCSRCLKECKPEGHHPDYSKPLEVIWLCRECHNKEHGK